MNGALGRTLAVLTFSFLLGCSSSSGNGGAGGTGGGAGGTAGASGGTAGSAGNGTGGAGGATRASCSYADVSSAITAASSGDTVAVPAGSCTWNTQLLITKGVILQGAGVGQTTITGNTGSGVALIKYQPANPASNEPFRITGFTFDLINSLAINITLTSNAYPISKVRIDHNNFLNSNRSGGRTIELHGAIWGVMDNNTMSGDPSFSMYGLNSLSDWDDLTFSYGNAENFFIEDNTFNIRDGFVVGGHGGRYVFRYNTTNFNNPGSGLWAWLDLHGNQNELICNSIGSRGGEIYGNMLTSLSGGNVRFIFHRGGQLLAFFNKETGFTTYSSLSMEEYNDSVCGSYTMHVNNSYYWNNRHNDTVMPWNVNNFDRGGVGLEYEISKNVDFYNYNPSFNGTTGMGCGTLASRPATCTTGVGYWATNQSCSSVNSANIGANPTTPISGALYKCTSTNTWTKYYTPYTYPHPLTISLNSAHR